MPQAEERRYETCEIVYEFNKGASNWWTARYRFWAKAVGAEGLYTAGCSPNFHAAANECREDVIRDIRDGTIMARLDVDPEIRRRLAARLRPSRARARVLDGLLDQHGALRPADYWPVRPTSMSSSARTRSIAPAPEPSCVTSSRSGPTTTSS